MVSPLTRYRNVSGSDDATTCLAQQIGMQVGSVHRGKLPSWPHLEPDPKYELEKHIEMFLAKNEIRGEPFVGVFGQFYHD